MSCYCDYDAPEFFTVTRPKARKQHKCYECSGVIVPGEKYESTSGKWDGWLDTFKVCARCAAMRKWLLNNLPCFCWAYGNLWEDAKSAVEDAAWRAKNEVAGVGFGLGRHMVQIKRYNAQHRATS